MPTLEKEPTLLLGEQRHQNLSGVEFEDVAKGVIADFTGAVVPEVQSFKGVTLDADFSGAIASETFTPMETNAQIEQYFRGEPVTPDVKEESTYRGDYSQLIMASLADNGDIKANTPGSTPGVNTKLEPELALK